jgi:hypothetical protein
MVNNILCYVLHYFTIKRDDFYAQTGIATITAVKNRSLELSAT